MPNQQPRYVPIPSQIKLLEQQNATLNMQPLDVDFSIGGTDCTHVDGIPTMRQQSSCRSGLLNRPDFLPIK